MHNELVRSPEPQTELQKIRLHWRLGQVAIAFFSFLIYLPTLWGKPIWDDVPLLYGNDPSTRNVISAFTHPFGNFYRPLTTASIALERSIAHGNPIYFHATNLILHAMTALLVASLALILTHRHWAGILAGLSFAVQPMQVGATAWIGGRTDVLAAFLLTAFLVLHLRHLQEGKLSLLIGSAISLLLAALSKEQSLAILPIIPISVLLLKSKDWKELRPYAIPFGGAILIFVGLWIIGGPKLLSVHDPIPVMVLNLLRTTSHYGLGFLTPNAPSLITFTLQPYQGFIWVPVGAAMIAIYGLVLRQVWKSHPSVAWLMIAAVLVYIPVCNFPSVPSLTVAPYRCALAGVPLACILGWCGLKSAAIKQPVFVTLIGAHFAWSGWITWTGVHQWLDPDAFFHAVAQNDPHFLTVVEFDARRLDNIGKTDEAATLTEGALTWVFNDNQWAEIVLRANVDSITQDVQMRLKSTTGIVNKKALGIFMADHAKYLAKLGQVPRAAVVAQDALYFAGDEPFIHYLYGRLVLKKNRKDAIKHWRIALGLDPGFDDCALSLGHQEFLDHNYRTAAGLLEPALRRRTDNGFAWFELARCKASWRDDYGAEAALSAARKARFRPEDRQLNAFAESLVKVNLSTH